MRFAIISLCAVASLAGPATRSLAEPNANIQALLGTLRDVDRQGKGHRAATAAWTELARQSTANDLPTILTAIDGAGPLAANWLRAVVDAVAERSLKNDGQLPTLALQKFLDDKQHDGRARRLAFEWIVRSDPGAKQRLVPAMIDDPSLELRRDAVQQVLDAAAKVLENKQNDQAVVIYSQALTAARDLDQVKIVTEALDKLGRPVDLPRHFGFLQDWQIIAPFENRQGKGFDVAYPPEKGIDLSATLEGQDGAMLRWKPEHTDDPYGQVDLNKALGKVKGAVAYAAAEFQSDQAGPVELRLGTEAANKIWLNGKLLSTANVYHANGTMDQYTGRGELKPGKNVILLKICQNEQTEEWAQDWKFQLRVCDASGKAILSTDRPPAKAPATSTAATRKD